MDVFAGEMMVNAVGMQVFAVKKDGAYRHFFSISSRTYVNVDKLRKWVKRKGKNKMYVFEYYALYDEVYELFTKIESEASLSFVYETSNIKIDFGHLVSRPLIFIPNVPGNSISNGWWPAAMNDGFACKQLIGDFEFEITLQAKTNAIGFIKERVGVDLNFLEDYIGSAIFILNQEQQVNDVSFNQDMMQLLYTRRGGLSTNRQRVLMEAIDGEEGMVSELFDLKEDDFFCSFELPFLPTKIGYRLYEEKASKWQLIGQKTTVLMQEMQIEMNMVIGKLTVKKGESVIAHDITTKDRPIRIASSSKSVPWLVKERRRIKANKGIEIRQLGSVFAPYTSSGSREIVLRLINEELFEKARERIWIWDPYLDESILDKLIILSVRKRGMDVKLLMSEYRGERAKGRTDANEFIRSDAMKVHLITKQSEVGTPLTIEVRNWFRAGKHTFHDRFLILDDMVWSIGSSLKDIGNYHTTIYRLEGQLPGQVIDEFKKGWDGRFGHMEPDGLQVFPEWKSIKIGEEI